jgi:hypothetical protein
LDSQLGEKEAVAGKGRRFLFSVVVVVVVAAAIAVIVEELITY